MIRMLRMLAVAVLAVAGMAAGIGTAAAVDPHAAAALAGSRGVAEPARGYPDGDTWEITIWEDDPAEGARRCRQAERDYAPARCHVEPESAAPNPNEDGWAEGARLTDSGYVAGGGYDDQQDDLVDAIARQQSRERVNDAAPESLTPYAVGEG